MRTAKVVMIGDSMTDCLGAFPSLRHLLQDRAGIDVDIVNHGIGGTRIGYALYRLTHQHKHIHRGDERQAVSREDADVILLESFAYNNRADHDFGLDSYRDNIRALISRIRATMRGRLIMYATISPDYDHFVEHAIGFVNTAPSVRRRMAEQVDWYVDAFREEAEAHGVRYVDVYGESKAAITRGTPVAYFINQGDGIHPNEYGAKYIARALAPAILDELDLT